LFPKFAANLDLVAGETPGGIGSVDLLGDPNLNGDEEALESVVTLVGEKLKFFRLSTKIISFY
jgi:hypothetical protein